jgi:hypothetical protein
MKSIPVDSLATEVTDIIYSHRLIAPSSGFWDFIFTEIVVLKSEV